MCGSVLAPVFLFANPPEAAPEKTDLNPGRFRSWADAPERRVRPGLEIHCRFRLDELRPGTQNLAVKDGEYILRVNGMAEGGRLAMFVKLDDEWEPRLQGPVVQPGVWYEVAGGWTGLEMWLEVNGERFRSQRQGIARPGAQPLLAGPLAGALEALTISNPAQRRSAALTQLDGASMEGESRHRFGGEFGWGGWRAEGGAICRENRGSLEVEFPTPEAMVVSPPLAGELAALPYVCLDVEAPGNQVTGCLEVISKNGAGSLPFAPLGGGRTTLLAGTASDAWMGELRRLALSVHGATGPVHFKRLVLSAEPEGVPWFAIQDFAPGRAKLRPGREETVIAGIKNLGGEVENVRLKLGLPEGVEILGAAEQTIPYLGKDDFDMVTWRIRAVRAGTFEARISVAAARAETREQDLKLFFEPLPDLPKAEYVPEPRPACTDYIGLMHYCALWKEGSHYGWKRIEPWPGRRPAIGWYDEGTPEVADWHIKYAVEHGINGFIYCWYRAHLEPRIEHNLGHAIHDGLFAAKYRDRFHFCIMWENGCAEGVKDAADLLDNVLPYWLENYFKHPSYLKVDNRPVLFVWQPRRLLPQLGGPEGTRIAFEEMRARCRASGFAGLRIIACMDGPEEKLGREIEASGWDAVSGYVLNTRQVPVAGIDADGIPYRDYGAAMRSYKETWQARDACTGPVPDIPNVVMGWDPRPWHRGGDFGYIANPSAAEFEGACRDAKALADAKPADRWDRKLVVFDNWTEFGEGHYLEPTSALGFSYVNAIKRVFCSEWAPEPFTDLIPEDLGLVPPQSRYEQARAGFGPRMPWQPLRIQGDLLAHWGFDAEEGGFFLDSSGNGCVLKRGDLRLGEGKAGRALDCGEGAAGREVPTAFFHPGGVTVALWCKPGEAAQSDRWMVNTMANSHSGYRLGLDGGRPAWQVPVESWSHSLIASEPLPVGVWSHVAATVDHRLMRLFVNGREVASLERRGFIQPGRDLALGGYAPAMERAHFRGELDEVRIYRRPLDAQEIAGLAR